MKSLFLVLLILFTFGSTYGQNSNSEIGSIKNTRPKVFLPNDNQIPKSIIQKRKITDYFDGGAARCEFFGSERGCDYKIRDSIWQCWNEKTLCYLTISISTVDAFSTVHIFIEPKENNRWRIVRQMERSHALSRTNEIVRLPTAYTVERIDDKEQKDEWILTLKNKFGEVVGEY